MSISLRQPIKRLVGSLLMRANRFVKQQVIVAEREALMKKLGHCEADLEVIYPWDIRGEQHVYIGKDVFLGPGALIIAGLGANVQIGNKVMFGPQVKLIASDHRIDDCTRPIKDSGYGEVSDICIGNDVWIGSSAIILKGVQIGDGAVVGAGSVVTRNIGAYEVWAGNPARRLRSRIPVSQSDQEKHHAAG